MTEIRTNNDAYQVLMALKTNRKKRSELGEIFIEGIEAIKQAVASPAVRPRKVLFTDYDGLSDWGKRFIDSAGFQEIIRLEPGLYEGLSDKNEPSEIMMTAGCDLPVLSDIALPEKPFIVISDRPSDCGNLGALIRTANSFGVDAFITHGHCVDFFDPKVIRSSLGAVFHTRICHVDAYQTLADWLNILKSRHNLSIIGTDSNGTVSAQDKSLSRPVALILGNEAKGISVRLRQLSDQIVSIPIQGAVNSLNVACAGSILMWQIRINSGP
jgi:TrmH family RNA methyltransferase